jgi:hypothetical protein
MNIYDDILDGNDDVATFDDAPPTCMLIPGPRTRDGDGACGFVRF